MANLLVVTLGVLLAVVSTESWSGLAIAVSGIALVGYGAYNGGREKRYAIALRRAEHAETEADVARENLHIYKLACLPECVANHARLRPPRPPDRDAI